MPFLYTPFQNKYGTAIEQLKQGEYMQVKLKLSYIIYTLLILSNLIFIHSTSALSYSSDVNVGFTFNPTLSVSLSSSDLLISNLTPGSTGSSNEITVNVATNAANGYALSATVGHNSTYSTDSLVNSVDNNRVFSNIATDANLSLSDIEASESTNIWGYSYKDNTLATPAWSNYNGLPLYSSTGVTLIDNDNTADSTGNIDFKIAAKASSTQASGVYNNVINFTAVPRIVPLTLLESFIAHNATQYNSYFTMQGMTPEICRDAAVGSTMQLLDVRDNKLYWVAKLADENCWMTQNLNLDLSSSVALTSETSDIDPTTYNTGIYTEAAGYSRNETTGVVSWLPSTIVDEDDGSGGTIPVQHADTIAMVWSSNTTATVAGWTNNTNSPYSADAGERYRYTNTSGTTTVYTSLNACLTGTNNDTAGCEHTHLGNYYNWSATVASNSTSSAGRGTSWNNSICPKNWDLPANGKYGTMLDAQDVWTGTSNTYDTDGFLKIRTSPLYFVRSGYVVSGILDYFNNGHYWSSTAYDGSYSRFLLFKASTVDPISLNNRSLGSPVRCMVSSSL